MQQPPQAQQAAPVEAPQVTAPSYPAGCEPYVADVSHYDWNVTTAMQVMKAESGCNPAAYNGSGLNRDGSNDAGLFQVNSVHCGRLIACQDRFDPYKNIAVAYAIYRGSGWNAWSVCHTKVNCF